MLARNLLAVLAVVGAASGISLRGGRALTEEAAGPTELDVQIANFALNLEVS